MSVLVVGELNPYGADPHFALYHLPRHASGNRLREHLGLTDVQYERLLKINLCCDKWSMPAARGVAEALMEDHNMTAIIMLGSKVKKAFGLEHLGFFDNSAEVQPTMIALPHPSGLNRLWNEPDAEQKARDLLSRLCPEIYEE